MRHVQVGRYLWEVHRAVEPVQEGRAASACQGNLAIGALACRIQSTCAGPRTLLGSGNHACRVRPRSLRSVEALLRLSVCVVASQGEPVPSWCVLQARWLCALSHESRSGA